MVAARAREIYDNQARERMTSGVNQYTPPEKLPEANKGDARDQAGKAVGVSGRVVATCPERANNPARPRPIDHHDAMSQVKSNKNELLLTIGKV
ncbi:MAG: hypothetical protein ACOWWM_09520 [Desulfobacterales bacterium]